MQQLLAVYKVIGTNGNGCVDSSEVTVVINALPTITAGSDEPKCVGETLNLTSSGTSTSWMWSGPNSFTSTSEDPVIMIVSAAAAGTYKVVGTNGNGCVDSSEVTVVINALPTITAGSDEPKCVGETLNLTSSGTSTMWLWSGPNSFTSTAEDPVIMNVSAAAGGVYKVIGTNGNGCVDSSEVTVVINALPTITAGSDEPKCVGETLNLTSSGTSTMWLWSGPNSFTSTAEDPVIMIVSAAAAGTYKVVGTNGNGCVDSSEVTVVINALPTITAGSDEPKCVGETLNLTSSGTSTMWLWSGPNSFTSTAEDPVIMNVSAAAAGTYKVIGTNGNGCVDSSEVTVVINALPTITAGSDEPKCVGETLNLTSSGTSTSWMWSGPNSFTSTSEDPVIMIVSAAAAGTYKVVGTNGNGCVDSSEVTVVINALPTITAGSDEPKCVGETLNLTSSGTSTSWIWSGPNSFTSTAEDPVIMNVSAAAAGTYKVVGTNGNGCVDSSEVTVVINALPTITAGSDEPKCVGETLNLTSSGTSTMWLWSGPNSFTSTAEDPVIMNVSAAAAGTYKVIGTNGNGCVDSSEVTVVINALPTITAGSDEPKCVGETLNLTSSGTSTMWLWSGPNSFTSTAEDPVIMIVSAAAAGTYKVVGTNGNGCVDSSEVTVVINALPTITAGSDEPKCVGETLNLTSSGTSTMWLWSGPNSFTSTAEDPVIMIVSAAAAGTYKVIGTNGNGCVDSSEVTVVINALPTITAGSDEPKCVGETLNLTSSGTSTMLDCGVARIVLQVQQKIP